MQIAKTHMIVFSPCGGTLHALRAMEPALPRPVAECHVTLPRSRTDLKTFGPDDLVFLGFPVYGGRLPRMADKIFSILNAHQTPAVLVAVYGNRDYEDALLEMHMLAQSRGFVPFAAAAVVAEHVMAPEVAARRPDVQDRSALEHFGRAVAERIRTLDAAGSITFTAPGEQPFRKPPLHVPFVPETSEACTGCGTCVLACPVAAVPEGNPNATLAERCLACMACVRFCPSKARSFAHPGFAQRAQWLRDNCMPRREPEFFPPDLLR